MATPPTPAPVPRVPRFTMPTEYTDGRTKQAYVDSCNINNIMNRAARAGGLSHIAQHGGHYADYSDFDFQEAQNTLARGRSIFDSLPHQIRREFNNDPTLFFQFANDPQNVNRLTELFPELARPGRQLPNVASQRAAPPRAEPEPEPQPPTDTPPATLAEE